MNKKKKQIKPKNPREIRPYKKQEFEIYIAWRSLPSVLRKQSPQILETLGFDDELSKELMSIKTQRDFSKRYKVDETVLVTWNKSTELEVRIRKNFEMWRKLTPNVILGLYRKAVSGGSAPEVKLWFQIIEDWKEEIKTEIDINAISIHKRLIEIVHKIRKGEKIEDLRGLEAEIVENTKSLQDKK